MYFKKLLKNKEPIEQAFGNTLVWEELPDNKMSRIKIELQGVNLFNETYWQKMNDFFYSIFQSLKVQYNRLLKI